MSDPVAFIDSSMFVGAKKLDAVEHVDCVRVLELYHDRHTRVSVSATTLSELLTGHGV